MSMHRYAERLGPVHGGGKSDLSEMKETSCVAGAGLKDGSAAAPDVYFSLTISIFIFLIS